MWRKILANVLNIRIDLPVTEEGPGYGGAMLAMVGCGAYESVRACADALVSVRESVKPEPELTALYEARYQAFRRMYPALKDTFRALAAL